MERRKTLVCEVCGREGAQLRRTARTYGKGKHILVIENVPAMTCPHRGESYMEAGIVQ